MSGATANGALSEHTRHEIDHWLAKFPADRGRSAVLGALRAAQHQNKGFLTTELMDAVADYLALPNPGDERSKRITATHVLSHSGGWRNWRNNNQTVLTADFDPGSRFSYSGEGYFFLQRIVESLTGKGIPQLARQRLFEPLGMRNSGLIWRPQLDATLASPHTNRGVPIDSHNARMGRAFQPLAGDIGKPVDDWSASDVEKAMPRADANLPVLPNFLVPNAAASLMTSARDYGRSSAGCSGPAR